ncbi:Receptor protein-tyrosine kinase [Alteripontixanthobacter maritimus]|uniref:Receptor protein-tyrosine kinase n=1 Tax=Alteripontixanthobacter maritimus TaxID=2161824 RepID=A0A369Q6N4_9SPHN|nr:capsular biosynthesis protein [Alteripontixanthobacter maritimus]RDC60080.1 Receptor protein-tyrosine kinase [Alteripontixanthobacter maritimus]
MTEHTKIPLPGEPAGKDDNSLLEKASGAFGLGNFKAAPMPETLDERRMKRARPVRKTAGEAAAPTTGQTTAEPVAAPADFVSPDMTGFSVPATVPMQEMVAEPPADGSRRVVFQGVQHAIDTGRLAEKGMILPGTGPSGLLEEFRIVKRQLIGAARERGTDASRRIMVTSPLPGEGKTYCATNLAIAMAAERDGEVLLVDADFGNPSIVDLLGLPAGPGLMDALSNESVAVEDFVLGTDIPGLWVLPAGTRTGADAEYLASTRTADVLDRLTAGADRRMVIFDTPPALAASPAAELAKHVGQTVLVARADTTGQNALEDAVQLLAACPDLKLLLNASSFSPSGRRFGSYYGYGE